METEEFVLTDQQIIEEIQRTLVMEAESIAGLRRWIRDEEWVRLVRLLAEHKGRIVLSLSLIHI